MDFKKLLSYLGIPYVVYKTKSEHNGEITVYSIFGQSSVSVGNLTQSGSIVENLWSFAVSQVKDIKSCLVLGVGGGSIIRVLRKKYPDSDITGVEIDKEMINIGKKYFELDKYDAKIIIDDAFKYVRKTDKKFDLICIDLLVGKNTPKKLSSEEFFRNIKRILKSNGVVIINQLRLKGQEENKKLIYTVNKIFISVEIKKPLVNTLIFCSII